jgi:hypothetical protein
MNLWDRYVTHLRDGSDGDGVIAACMVGMHLCGAAFVVMSLLGWTALLFAGGIGPFVAVGILAVLVFMGTAVWAATR